MESLYEIDYYSFNVIVVDNDSNDDSIDKIRDYTKENDIKYIQLNYKKEIKGNFKHNNNLLI